MRGNMWLREFKQNLDSKNICNPFSDEIKQLAHKEPIAKELLTNCKFVGTSATESDYEWHHIYDSNLFPVYHYYGIGTAQIQVSKEIHLKLHKQIANADFVNYEASLKSECPTITANISEEYHKRIKSLPSKFKLLLLVFVKKWKDRFLSTPK